MDRNDYLKDLKSPQWQKKRLEIMQRDNFTCQFCGSQDRMLHVHHKFYIDGKKPLEYEDNHLITLCNRCHEYIADESNSLYDSFKETRDYFRKFGFSDAVFSAILISFASFFERIENNEEWSEDNEITIIDNAVCGTQNYDDFKMLARLGVKHDDFVMYKYPKLIDDYKSVKKDE